MQTELPSENRLNMGPVHRAAVLRKAPFTHGRRLGGLARRWIKPHNFGTSFFLSERQIGFFLDPKMYHLPYRTPHAVAARPAVDFTRSPEGADTTSLYILHEGW
jgi:hypothetical protein